MLILVLVHIRNALLLNVEKSNSDLIMQLHEKNHKKFSFEDYGVLRLFWNTRLEIRLTPQYECGFSEQTPRLIFCTYALRLRSTPSAILLTYACCWSNQHKGGTAAKCHLWLEDETAPFSPSFGRRTRVSAELGCRGRNVENGWYNVIIKGQHIHSTSFCYNITITLYVFCSFHCCSFHCWYPTDHFKIVFNHFMQTKYFSQLNAALSILFWISFRNYEE